MRRNKPPDHHDQQEAGAERTPPARPFNKVTIGSNRVKHGPYSTKTSETLLYGVLFDQICMTFQTPAWGLLEAFDGLLGIDSGYRPRSREGDELATGTMYPFDIRVSDFTKYGWARLQFPGTEEAFTAVSCISASIPVRRNIQSAELAFDFPTDCASENEVLVPLRQLALHLVPKHRGRARFVFQKGKKVKQCHDGAVNGLQTFYINSLDEKKSTKEKRVPAKFRSKGTKVYSKEIDGTWFVRCEITLFRDACRKVISHLPNEWDQFCDICNRAEFSDFWRLIEVDREAFRKRARELANRKPSERVPAGLHALLEGMKGASALDQIICMKKIAKLLRSKHLERELPTFYRELTLEEVFDRPLPGESRYR